MKAIFPSGVSVVKIDDRGRVILNSGITVFWKWRVTLGKKITGTGKQRKLFDSYDEAKEFANNALLARKQKGREALLLKPVLMHEALACITKLREAKATLSDATNFYLRHHRPGHLNRTFAQVAAEFLRFKRTRNRRHSTIRAYAGCYRRFNADHRKVPINRITARNIETWLDDRDIGPLTRRNYLRDLSVLWNFAVDNDYLTVCEPAELEKPILDERPNEILTVAQPNRSSPKLKRNRIWSYSPISPFPCLQALRTNEMLQLQWSQIHLDESIIMVTPSQSKTSADAW